jgi:hypothetical protein
VIRKGYRSTTETANKQDAKKIEAKERPRILDGRHGIRQQPDIMFRTTVNRDLDTLRSVFSKVPENTSSGAPWSGPAS